MVGNPAPGSFGQDVSIGQRHTIPLHEHPVEIHLHYLRSLRHELGDRDHCTWQHSHIKPSCAGENLIRPGARDQVVGIVERKPRKRRGDVVIGLQVNATQPDRKSLLKVLSLIQ